MDFLDIFEQISLKGGDEYVCIKIFEHTAMRETRFIKLDILDTYLRLGAGSVRLNMFMWKTNDSGTRSFVYDEDAKLLSINQLIIEDKNIYEYCKKFYPDRVI